MVDFLYSIDLSIFTFINSSLANPVSDVVFPFFTHLTETWYGITILSVAWLALFFKGGKQGKAVALLIIPLVTLSDQMSSTLVKKFVMRPRPCHDIDGVAIVQHIRLLVPCGSGYSFPSSHATNAFAIATFVAYYFRHARAALFTTASLVALSRVVVGVHYPSDILAGGLLGAMLASLMIVCWNYLQRFVFTRPQPPHSPGIAHDAE